MKLGVTGSRYIFKDGKEFEFMPDIFTIINKIDEYFKNEDVNVAFYLNYYLKNITELNSGGAIGFDTTAENYFNSNYSNIKINIFRPNYIKKPKTQEEKLHNKRAPMIRNLDIMKASDFVLGVSSHENSNGTRNAISHCEKLNIPFVHVLYNYVENSFRIIEYSIPELFN